LGFAIIAGTAYPNQIISLFILLFIFLSIAASTQTAFVAIGGRAQQIVAIGVVCITLCIGIRELSKKQYYKDWKTALELVHQGDTQNGFYAYSLLYPVLADDKSFLFNYGAELSVAEQYEQSIPVLEQAKPLMNDYSVYLYLGHSYAATGQYALAEQHLKAACLRIPSRIYARYRLFALYAEHGDTALAMQTGKTLINTIDKGKSKNTENMKDEARDYMQSHQENN